MTRRARIDHREPTPWRSALGGLAIASSLALLGQLPQSSAAAALGSQAQAMRDVAELERAEERFAGLNGGYVEPGVLATPGRLPAAMATDLPSGRFLDRRFLEPTRNGYRFEFRGSEPVHGNLSYPVVQPAYRAYSYAAAPAGGSGRTFAYYSYRSGCVFYRDDGVLPTLDDKMLELP
jgi:hypothetical protein